jgi:hypothetical protein
MTWPRIFPLQNGHYNSGLWFWPHSAFPITLQCITTVSSGLVLSTSELNSNRFISQSVLVADNLFAPNNSYLLLLKIFYTCTLSCWSAVWWYEITCTETKCHIKFLELGETTPSLNISIPSIQTQEIMELIKDIYTPHFTLSTNSPPTHQLLYFCPYP